MPDSLSTRHTQESQGTAPVPLLHPTPATKVSESTSYHRRPEIPIRTKLRLVNMVKSIEPTGYGLAGRVVGIPAPVGSRIFSSSSRPPLGPTRSPMQWVQGGVKLPGCEAEHSPPTSGEVKEMWIYTSTPPYALMV
jgi:hypothetical protein